jgi:hypothetical protein
MFDNKTLILELITQTTNELARELESWSSRIRLPYKTLFLSDNSLRLFVFSVIEAALN